jgi:hypothetical protein
MLTAAASALLLARSIFEVLLPRPLVRLCSQILRAAAEFRISYDHVQRQCYSHR